MARRIAVAALVTLAVSVPASGGGGTLFGLQGSQADGRLVRVNPTTLRSVGPALRVGNYTAERAVSPDGRTIALVSQDRPTVRFVDLQRLRTLGHAELAAEGEVHVLRWTERGLVAVVEPARGFVLVWLDPEQRRVTRVLRYRGEPADFRLAAGRVAVLEWPSGVVGPVRLNVIDADGRARSIRVDRIRGGWERKAGQVVRVAEPALAIDPSGERAWLADADGEICEVVLDSLAVRCNTFRTLAKNSMPWSRRQLKLVADGTLALSGWEKPEPGPRAAKSIGLWLVDTTTWRRRLLNPGVDALRFAGGVIVGVRRNGVTAYAPTGSVRYRIEEPEQLGVLSTAGPYLYIPRLDRRTVVADLATGRVLGRPVAAVTPFQELDTW